MSDHTPKTMLAQVSSTLFALFSSIVEKVPKPLTPDLLDKLDLFVLLYTEDVWDEAGHIYWESSNRDDGEVRRILDSVSCTYARESGANVTEGPLNQPIHLN
jgi:hypothetical protein